MAEQEFSIFFPTKNTHLDKYPLTREPLWKSRSPAGHNWIKKFLELNSLKRVRGIVSLYSCHPSPIVAHLEDRRDFLACD